MAACDEEHGYWLDCCCFSRDVCLWISQKRHLGGCDRPIVRKQLFQPPSLTSPKGNDSAGPMTLLLQQWDAIVQKSGGWKLVRNVSIVIAGKTLNHGKSVGIKRKNTLSQLCYCSADVPPPRFFSPPPSLSCCTNFLALANISLLSHLSSPPSLSLSLPPTVSIYLPIPLGAPPPYNQCGF